MKKILCALPQVTGGGAERFFINFLNNIDRSLFTPVVVLGKGGGGYEYEIPDDLKIYILSEISVATTFLAPTGPFKYLPSLVGVINKVKPDAIISFGSLFNGIVTLSSRLARGTQPTLIIEAIHESTEISRYKGLQKWFRIFFLKFTYPFASKIVAVSDLVGDDLVENFGINQQIIEIIYNGIDIESINTLSQQKIEHQWLHTERNYGVIVACGRLVEQKGFKFLIEAISLIKNDVRLILIGDGEEKQSIIEQIDNLNLTSKIDLIGYKRNPFPYIAQSDLFVMPSLWEGFGIILIEALALHKPTIAFDCYAGPKTILENGKHGILVPVGDVESLAANIDRLSQDNKLRKELSQKSAKRSYDFSIAECLNKYTKVLLELCST